MVDENLQKAVSEIFEGLDIKDSLNQLDILIEHIEDLIDADYMWLDAANDESTRRIIVAAVGVIAIKFGNMDEDIIEFINNEEEEEK
jgi:hypothetical protein